MKGVPMSEAHKQLLREGKARKAAERRERVAAQLAEPAAAPVVESPDEPVVLTEAELAMIRQKARAKIDAEIAAKREAEREALLARTLEDEVLNQRREAGLTDYRDDIVEFMVNVSPVSMGLVVDGHVYPHGTWLKKTRREYDSYREIMALSWASEDRAGNPNKKFAHERALIGTQNPLLMETHMADGSFTVGSYMPSVNGQTGMASGMRGRA